MRTAESGVVEEGRAEDQLMFHAPGQEAYLCLWVRLWLIVLKVDIPQIQFSGN